MLLNYEHDLIMLLVFILCALIYSALNVRNMEAFLTAIQKPLDVSSFTCILQKPPSLCRGGVMATVVSQKHWLELGQSATYLI